MVDVYQLKMINEREIDEAINRYQLDPFFAKLLVTKGYTLNEIEKIINLEKALLPASIITNITTAAQYIADFIGIKSHAIFAFGDYDVDGIMSLFVLFKMLKPVSACPIHIHVPERKEGYGMNMEWCQTVVNELRNYDEILVITIDNGIAQYKEIAFLQKHGIHCIVVDHHEPKENIPECLIVDPYYNNDTRALHLCGTSLAFKLCQIIQKQFDVNTAYDVIDCVMLATIADMMPTTCENLAFCYFGLQKIKGPHCHKGIKRLIEKSNKDIQTINYSELGFIVNTKLNACGRLDHAQVAYDFMMHPENELLTEQVIAYNDQRIKLANTAFEEITKKPISSHCVSCVTFPGICSAIVNKIMKITHDDVIVFTPYQGVYKGSGRSYHDNILKHVDMIANQFSTLEYGGHKEAIGITIGMQEFERFQKAFDRTYTNPVNSRVRLVDFFIPFEQLNKRILDTVYSIPYTTDEDIPLIQTTAQITAIKPTYKNPANAMVTLSHGDTSLTLWLENGINITNNLPQNKDITVICTIEKPWKEGDTYSLKLISLMDNE